MHSRAAVAAAAAVMAGLFALLVLARPTPPSAGSTDAAASDRKQVAASPVEPATSDPGGSSQSPSQDPAGPAPTRSAALTFPSPMPTFPPLQSPRPSVACGEYTVIYDSLEPTIEYQGGTAPDVFVAELVAVGDAFLVPSGAYEPGEGEGSIAIDAYRPVTLEVTEVAKGSDLPSTRSVMVPGGTVGCADFLVAGFVDLNVGQRYAFFVGDSGGSLPSNPPALVTYAAWPVTAEGVVRTPLDGDLTIDAFVAAVRSAAE